MPCPPWNVRFAVIRAQAQARKRNWEWNARGFRSDVQPVEIVIETGDRHRTGSARIGLESAKSQTVGE